MKNSTPILLIIFNRPEHTLKVIDSIRKIQPRHLFIAADGPRKNNAEDIERCNSARKYACSIDWDCNLKTRFLDNNVGCGLNVSSAITWFFQEVEYGVILEDDCIPHPHFFQFCSELLERYKSDSRIMSISGFCPYPPSRNSTFDYHFSRRFYCIGWGTWRRAWNHFTYDMSGIKPEMIEDALKNYYPFIHSRRSWKKNIDRVLNGDLKTWAIRWDMCCFLQNGLTICPEKNLIQNIGFGSNATHTHNADSVFANLSLQELSFPLRHPIYVYHDWRREKEIERILYSELSLKSRFVWHARHILGGIIDYINTIP
jgi:hypothetical protein